MYKPESRSKEKRKRLGSETSKKRVTPSLRPDEKITKKEDEEKASRKTRWETGKNETEKQASSPKKDEEFANPEPPKRLRDLLGDKKTIIEYLFLTVTVPTLQKLIPDYLKDRSIEELKNLCSDEIKALSDDQILDLASGAENQAESTVLTEESGLSTVNPESESSSSDLLELCANSNDLEDLDEEVPIEGFQDHIPPIENEVDLMELEMRARAIRSLLKAKGKDFSDSEDSNE